MDLGFTSASEVSSGSLADAFAMYMVSLEGLSKYSPGQAPTALLIDEGNSMYPVTVLGSPKAAVVVTQRPDGTWEPSSFGYARVASSAYAARETIVTATGIARADISLVRIPTMAAWFVAYTESGQLVLTPLYDLPRAGLSAGKAVPATDAFQRLQPLAAHIDPSKAS